MKRRLRKALRWFAIAYIDSLCRSLAVVPGSGHDPNNPGRYDPNLFLGDGEAGEGLKSQAGSSDIPRRNKLLAWDFPQPVFRSTKFSVTDHALHPIDVSAAICITRNDRPTHSRL